MMDVAAKVIHEVALVTLALEWKGKALVSEPIVFESFGVLITLEITSASILANAQSSRVHKL